MQITSENPLIVTTADDLKRMLAQMLSEMGISGIKQTEHKQEVKEMPTRLAKKYLIERGHKVVSDEAFRNIVKEYEVGSKKRGKENWYPVSELEKVPSRV